jgi:mannitol/fructose-specific phosphotransferase system IIA component (Ntr-type)
LNTLADYTSTELMLPQVRSTTAADVISELGDALDRAGRLKDRAAFVEAVLARELISPTSFSTGWALPHARLPDLPQLSFALARTAQPLTWIGEKAARIQTVWLFAVPEPETKAYLNLIAAVAKLSQNNTLIEQILRAPDNRTMYSVLEQVPLRRLQSLEVATNPVQRPATR